MRIFQEDKISVIITMLILFLFVLSSLIFSQENDKVELEVYSIIGRQVVTLVNHEKPAGEYSVSFDAAHLSSGIYIYKITAGDFTQSRKLVLLK